MKTVVYDPAKRRIATLRRFGLTPPDYARILLSQNGACAICRRVPTNHALHVDHDHRTNEIRGLLCHRCNRGLGYFSMTTAEALAQYMTQAPTGYVVPKRKRKR